MEGLGLETVGVLLFKVETKRTAKLFHIFYFSSSLQNIFEIAPGALALFSFKDEKPLYESDKLKKHGLTVVSTVGKAVAGLRDVEKLVPVLESLGKAHAAYGVEAEHFAVVGQALLKTLEMGLGDGYTDEVQKAWATVFEVVSTNMIKGLNEAKAEKEKNKA